MHSSTQSSLLYPKSPLGLGSEFFEKSASSIGKPPVVIAPLFLHLGSARLFLHYVQGAHFYLEWGSGGSTQLAPFLVSKKAFSIELHPKWCQQMQRENKMTLIARELARLTFLCVDHDEPLKEWGVPANHNSVHKLGVMYVNRVDDAAKQLRTEFPDWKVFNAVLIDGRYRVACALKLLVEAYVERGKSTILIDDFYERDEGYATVLEYYDLIDGNLDSARLAVFRPKIMTKGLKKSLMTTFKYYLDDFR